MNLASTIVALSTPVGRSGLGVVRMSGAQACAIAQAVLRFPPAHRWQARQAVVAALPSIDQVVVTWFEAPHSYTAEDVVEISCHGSPVVLRHLIEACCASGARLAEPGEFTLRAYVNGRLDLPRAEAVADLINATTLYQARVAHGQAHGSVSRQIAPAKQKLLELISLLEAGIDFADNDVDVAPKQEIIRRIHEVLESVSALARSFAFGKIVRAGLKLAIAGRPNVGKSSLFNRLVERDRAIVTDIPGTTRDLVSEVAAIDGIPVEFVDTAGIRASQDVVESLGIERSYQAIADADLTLAVVDASAPFTAEDWAIIGRARSRGPAIVVGNKIDVGDIAGPHVEVRVSALAGTGLAELRQAILERLAPGGIPAESGFITNVRHAQLLRECVQALIHASEAAHQAIPHEMLLLDLYAALAPLDAITGATTADDILNRIFATFCIGK